MKKTICLLLVLVFSPGHLPGQYYVTGTDPASIRWQQIKTENFRLIFPPTFASRAEYIANGLQYFYPVSGKTLNSHVKFSPVILHDRTTIPSSVTPYAPFRIDFFTSPPQDIYAQDWIDQLIIHEFRHANQYSAINRGFTRSLSWILGEQGVIAMLGIFVPLWFVEGDATVTETAFCNSGRGRVPSFEMRLRAQFIDKGVYSYEKAVNRSFKDMVPNPYELGYQIVGRTRGIYGKDVWSGVIENVGKYPFTLVPFTSGLKKETGLGKYSLYNSITGLMLSEWKEQDNKIKTSEFTIVSNTVRKFYSSYNLPAFLNDSLYITAKTSIDDIPRIILIDGEKNEKRLTTPGVNFSPESISISESKIYWSELVTNPRWSLCDYRVIKSYNFETGKQNQLTHHTRYYSPAVSRDGSMIAASEVGDGNKYYLTILKSSDGSLVKRMNFDNYYFIHPGWSEDGNQIVSVVFGPKGNSIALIDPWNEKLDLTLPFSSFEIKRPSVYKDYIIYTASYDGIDNIYAVNSATRDIFRVTTSRFGAADASVDQGKSTMIYSDYSSDGYNIAKIDLIPENWEKISLPVKSAFPLAESLSEQESFIFNSDSVPARNYEVKPYRKYLNLFNFHSWVPLGIDVQNFSMSPGVTLLSQNILGTSFTYLGYLYDPNQKTGKYYIQYSYEGLFPAFDISADWGSRRDVYYGNYDDTINLKWKELNLSGSIRLPLNWTKDEWTRSFEPSVGLSYMYLNMDNSVAADFKHDRIPVFNFSLNSSNMMKKSSLDIFSRWGDEIGALYSRTLTGSDINSILAGYMRIITPGIIRHHSLRIYSGYQNKNSTYYTFEDFIDPPRGYEDIFDQETACLYSDYSFPVGYPDLRLGHLAFIKRFKASLFFDYSAGLDSESFVKHRSAGADLSADLSILNFIAPFDMGVRTYYLLESRNIGFQFLFAININSIYGKNRDVHSRY